MVYLKDKISEVINASGRMTKLGVSTLSSGVLEAIKYGANHYFLIDELYEKAGDEVALLLNAPSAVITNSASAGIVLSVASVICRNYPYFILHHDEIRNSKIKKEVIIPKGQNVDYGVPVEVMLDSAGATVMEAGYANKVTYTDVEMLISENTAALFYVLSSHCVQKNMITLDEMILLSKKYNLPLILDCAAEIDFHTFIQKGIDFVIYSGSKALLGPTSGLVLVQNKDDADEIKKHFYGIGRSMKIGKENIFGLVQAVYEFVNEKSDQIVSYNDLDYFIEEVNRINGCNAIKVKDESGREIYRAKVHFDEYILRMNAFEIVKKLESGNPRIYTRNYELNLGNIYFDPRPLTSKSDLDKILIRIKEIILND